MVELCWWAVLGQGTAGAVLGQWSRRGAAVGLLWVCCGAEGPALEQGAVRSLGDRAAVAVAQLLPAALRPCTLLRPFLAAIAVRGKQENKGRRWFLEGLVAALCHLPAGIWGVGAVPNANPSTDFSELGEWDEGRRGRGDGCTFLVFFRGRTRPAAKWKKAVRARIAHRAVRQQPGCPELGQPGGSSLTPRGAPPCPPRAHSTWQPRCWEMLGIRARCGAAPVAPLHPGRIYGGGE